jgi:DNA-directed RNA polymerase specialized sigma24 family protein
MEEFFMLIRYEFCTGEVEAVEVNEEIGTVIVDSRREEANLDRKEHRHCWSLDAMTYEGAEFADPAAEDNDPYGVQEELGESIWLAFSKLSGVQRRRLKMLADGLSIREISRIEGKNFKTVYESIEAGRKKFLKYYDKTPHQSSSVMSVL